MSRFKLMHKQVLELENFLKDTKDKLEHTRALGVLNRHRGMTAEHAAAILNVTTVAVFKWCRRYKENGLDGKTPAEACGMKIEGNNKWKTIIQNASKM